MPQCDDVNHIPFLRMVRFSCFPAHIHTHKHKRTAQLSGEAMQKILEDPSETKDLSDLPDLATEKKPFSKEDGDIHNNVIDQVTDASLTERDCRSEEMDHKCSTDSDSVVNKKTQIKKSRSLGSRLNWQERTSRTDGLDDETERGYSYDDINNLEPVPSDSVQVGSDFTKNVTIFSIGDAQQYEKEGVDKDVFCLSGVLGSGDQTPPARPAIVKSTSLPRMGSPNRHTSFLSSSRSAEDLNALASRKKAISELSRMVQYQERDNLMDNNEKDNVENPDEDMYENYVGLAKDWVVPESDGDHMEKDMKGETSLSRWDQVPAKDFRLKRIEEWVNDLQQCDQLEESNESSPCPDPNLSEVNISHEDSATAKLDIKVNPGMEIAKRYISSLHASATAAQLSNLGLVVIPFLCAFTSLKALNLSGNAIVRISSGALPRGLHILNLSKNNITTIEGLRELTRLRVLDLSYNRILRIGHGLASCTSLKELYLAGNKISEVEGLHRLLKLNVLDLRFNKISTTKCLGQLAANYSCLQALSLEGNPAQKNVGDEQLKKYVQSLLPNLTYYNRQSIKVGTMKESSDRSSRLGIGAHQIDRGLQVDVKSARKGAHGIVAQKVSSSTHGRKSQVVASAKSTRTRRPPSGMKTTSAALGHQLADLSSKKLSVRRDVSSILRSRSEGNLGAL